MKYSFVARGRVVLVGVILFAMVLVAKLFLVQIVHSGAYSDAADHQYATPAGNLYERGTIYFERKDGELGSAATHTPPL